MIITSIWQVGRCECDGLLNELFCHCYNLCYMHFLSQTELTCWNHTVMRPGVHFTYRFKFDGKFVSIQTWAKWLWNIAPGTTVMLFWHVQYVILNYIEKYKIWITIERSLMKLAPRLIFYLCLNKTSSQWEKMLHMWCVLLLAETLQIGWGKMGPRTHFKKYELISWAHDFRKYCRNELIPFWF